MCQRDHTAWSIQRCTSKTDRMHTGVDTITSGRWSPESFLIETHGVWNAKDTADSQPLQLQTTSYHTKVMRSCSGIRATGNRSARGVTTSRRRQRTVASVMVMSTSNIFYFFLRTGGWSNLYEENATDRSPPSCEFSQKFQGG